MRKRTRSREAALKILYARDITGESVEECSRKFWESSEVVDDTVKRYSSVIVSGVEEHLSGVDGTIEKYADNWKLERMATIDRNILRIASFELLFLPEIPPKVAINEAIDIAKKYGDKDSGKFVNGILDKINKSEKVEERSNDAS